MKNNKYFVCLLIITLSLIIPVTMSAQPIQVDIPSYVLLTLVTLDSGRTVSQANSILIDVNDGLLITNAHIIKYGQINYIGVRIFNKWQFTRIRSEWINWSADLAIIQLNLNEIDSLPPAAVLMSDTLSLGDPAVFKGYLEFETADGKLFFRPVLINTLIRKKDARYGEISSETWAEFMKFRVSTSRTEEPPWKKLSMLYRNYLILEATVQIREMKQKIHDDLSGLALINKNSQVIGISSKLFKAGTLATAIPAFEIENLLIKAKFDLMIEELKAEFKTSDRNLN
ncbi:hypothetical protein IID20_04555 [Patescibacteria group bacterium]|nr:hypothetical protein [Patescibacteria group bacterium]